MLQLIKGVGVASSLLYQAQDLFNTGSLHLLWGVVLMVEQFLPSPRVQHRVN